MRLEIVSFNKQKEVTDFINSRGITKDKLISFFQERNGLYTLMYYAED